MDPWEGCDQLHVSDIAATGTWRVKHSEHKKSKQTPHTIHIFVIRPHRIIESHLNQAR